MSSRLVILMYHHVGRPPADARYRGMYVTERHLQWHVQLLQRAGFQIMTLAHGTEQFLQNGGKVACLTFDDGYVDNITAGFPTLQALGVPATVFVVTADIGKRQHIWREAGYQHPVDLMSWEQLRTLRAAGWEIGSHGSEHWHMAGKSPAEQGIWLENSFRSLRENLGEAPRSLAYPFGSFDGTTLQQAHDAGFQFGVTTLAGAQAHVENKLALRRMTAKGYRADHFIRALRLLF